MSDHNLSPVLRTPNLILTDSEAYDWLSMPHGYTEYAIWSFNSNELPTDGSGVHFHPINMADYCWYGYFLDADTEVPTPNSSRPGFTYEIITQPTNGYINQGFGIPHEAYYYPPAGFTGVDSFEFTCTVSHQTYWAGSPNTQDDITVSSTFDFHVTDDPGNYNIPPIIGTPKTFNNYQLGTDFEICVECHDLNYGFALYESDDPILKYRADGSAAYFPDTNNYEDFRIPRARGEEENFHDGYFTSPLWPCSGHACWLDDDDGCETVDGAGTTCQNRKFVYGIFSAMYGNVVGGGGCRSYQLTESEWLGAGMPNSDTFNYACFDGENIVDGGQYTINFDTSSFPGVVSGCTISNACNYNPEATLDDGSCEYTSCAGCTDSSALNYDSTATYDNGSCEYTSAPPIPFDRSWTISEEQWGDGSYDTNFHYYLPHAYWPAGPSSGNTPTMTDPVLHWVPLTPPAFPGDYNWRGSYLSYSKSSAWKFTGNWRGQSYVNEPISNIDWSELPSGTAPILIHSGISNSYWDDCTPGTDSTNPNGTNNGACDLPSFITPHLGSGQAFKFRITDACGTFTTTYTVTDTTGATSTQHGDAGMYIDPENYDNIGAGNAIISNQSATSYSNSTISSGPATITVNVTCIDDAPVASWQLTGGVNPVENGPEVPLTLFCSDLESDPVQYFTFIGGVTQDGIIRCDGQELDLYAGNNIQVPPTASCTYQPQPGVDFGGNPGSGNYGETDYINITCTVTNADGNDVDSGVYSDDIFITSTNAPPVAINATIDVDEDSSDNLIDFLIDGSELCSDVDEEVGPDLEFTFPDTDVTLTTTQNGTLTNAPGTGTLYYTPNPNFHGTDSFQWFCTDIYGTGSDSNIGTISINVLPTEDLPQALPVDPITTSKDTSVTFSLNCVDIDGNITGYLIKNEPRWSSEYGTNAHYWRGEIDNVIEYETGTYAAYGTWISYLGSDWENVTYTPNLDVSGLSILSYACISTGLDGNEDISNWCDDCISINVEATELPPIPFDSTITITEDYDGSGNTCNGCENQNWFWLPHAFHRDYESELRNPLFPLEGAWAEDIWSSNTNQYLDISEIGKIRPGGFIGYNIIPESYSTDNFSIVQGGDGETNCDIYHEDCEIYEQTIVNPANGDVFVNDVASPWCCSYEWSPSQHIKIIPRPNVCGEFSFQYTVTNAWGQESIQHGDHIPIAKQLGYYCAGEYGDSNHAHGCNSTNVGEPCPDLIAGSLEMSEEFPYAFCAKRSVNPYSVDSSIPYPEGYERNCSHQPILAMGNTEWCWNGYQQASDGECIPYVNYCNESSYEQSNILEGPATVTVIIPCIDDEIVPSTRTVTTMEDEQSYPFSIDCFDEEGTSDDITTTVVQPENGFIQEWSTPYNFLDVPVWATGAPILKGQGNNNQDYGFWGRNDWSGRGTLIELEHTDGPYPNSHALLVQGSATEASAEQQSAYVNDGTASHGGETWSSTNTYIFRHLDNGRPDLDGPPKLVTELNSVGWVGKSIIVQLKYKIVETGESLVTCDSLYNGAERRPTVYFRIFGNTSNGDVTAADWQWSTYLNIDQGNDPTLIEDLGGTCGWKHVYYKLTIPEDPTNEGNAFSGTFDDWTDVDYIELMVRSSTIDVFSNDEAPTDCHHSLKYHANYNDTHCNNGLAWAVADVMIEVGEEPYNYVGAWKEGNYTYNPDYNYYGADNTTFTCENSAGQTTTGDINITVVEVNDQPEWSVGLPNSTTITEYSEATDSPSDDAPVSSPIEKTWQNYITDADDEATRGIMLALVNDNYEACKSDTWAEDCWPIGGNNVPPLIESFKPNMFNSLQNGTQDATLLMTEFTDEGHGRYYGYHDGSASESETLKGFQQPAGVGTIVDPTESFPIVPGHEYRVEFNYQTISGNRVLEWGIGTGAVGSSYIHPTGTSGDDGPHWQLVEEGNNSFIVEPYRTLDNAVLIFQADQTTEFYISNISITRIDADAPNIIFERLGSSSPAGAGIYSFNLSTDYKGVMFSEQNLGWMTIIGCDLDWDVALGLNGRCSPSGENDFDNCCTTPHYVKVIATPLHLLPPKLPNDLENIQTRDNRNNIYTNESIEVPLYCNAGDYRPSSVIIYYSNVGGATSGFGGEFEITDIAGNITYLLDNPNPAKNYNFDDCTGYNYGLNSFNTECGDINWLDYPNSEEAYFLLYNKNYNILGNYYEIPTNWEDAEEIPTDDITNVDTNWVTYTGENIWEYYVTIKYKPELFFYGVDEIFYTCLYTTTEDIDLNDTFAGNTYIPYNNLFSNPPTTRVVNFELKENKHYLGLPLSWMLYDKPQDMYDGIEPAGETFNIVTFNRIEMNSLYQEISDNFGYPNDSNITIEQTLIDKYDPYSGIDLTTPEDEMTTCSHIEYMRLPTIDSYSDMIDGRYRLWGDFYPSQSDADKARYSACVNTAPEDDNWSEWPGKVNGVSRARVVCKDGSTMVVASAGGGLSPTAVSNTIDISSDSDDDGIFETESNDWKITPHINGEEACRSIIGDIHNTNIYFEEDLDKRSSLGLFYSKDENTLNDNFPINIPKYPELVFTNYLNNPNGKTILNGLTDLTYDTDFSGLLRPDGGATYPYWGVVDDMQQPEKSEFSNTGDIFNFKFTNPAYIISQTPPADIIAYVDSYDGDHAEVLLGKNWKGSDDPNQYDGTTCYSGNNTTSCIGAFFPAGGWNYLNYGPVNQDIYIPYGDQYPTTLDANYGDGTIHEYDPDRMYAGLLGYHHPFRKGTDDTPSITFEKLPFAHWTHSDNCRSFNRCLAFTSMVDGNQTNRSLDQQNTLGDDTWYPYYSTQNQFQQIYSRYQPDNQLNPYSTIKVSFWMKTTRWDSYDEKPEVEAAVLVMDKDVTESGYSGVYNPMYIPIGDGDGTLNLQNNGFYHPVGSYNSYTPTEGHNFLSWRGGSGRFSNSALESWEKKEFTFSLQDYHLTGTDVGDLFFMIQYGNDKKGTIWLDDFSVTEAYDFIPDVDVRKKSSSGKYGNAPLTEYYDPTITDQLEKYNDTTAPLEVQFYFYPQYNQKDIFHSPKQILHNDYSAGMFFIYDVDWGDDSPKEFISNPEPIGNDKMLYHTYTTSGIYEVTGYMLRMKPDNEYNPLGIAHNKRFTLRININEGLDEDFTYFGADGFSFIPYKETLPVIGGYSEESIYYKATKRQLGFISDTTKTSINFKKQSDKLKTEIALIKMTDEVKVKDELEILPEFEIPRNSESDGSGDVIWTGTVYSQNNAELGKTVGDVDLTNIKYFNKPKQMYEMLGFTNNETSIPNNPRYWKNIIHKDMPDTYREGVNINSSGIIIVDETSEQEWKTITAECNHISDDENSVNPVYKIYHMYDYDHSDGFGGTNPANTWVPSKTHECNTQAATTVSWMNGNSGAWDWDTGETPGHTLGKKKVICSLSDGTEREIIYIDNTGELNSNYAIYTDANTACDSIVHNYYYPVLPRYDKFGKYVYNSETEQNDYPNNNILFPLNAPITDENENDEALKININANKLDSNILNDNSGNKNYGFAISDFKPNFHKKTLEPKKIKNTERLRITKNKGAF